MLDTSPYEVELKNWGDIHDRYYDLSDSGKQWVFRGQESSKWQIRTTLERVIVRFGSAERAFPDKCDPQYSEKLDAIFREILLQGVIGHKTYRPSDIEGGLLRKFKRQCYLYTSNLPDDGDTMEWLALMRHYGAPTRLLDWTYSFFVALYFALESAEGEAAVWALNTDWLQERVRTLAPKRLAILEHDPHVRQESFNKIFLEQPQAAIYAINPYRRNERLSVQQGVFLCPGSIDIPFEDNLATILNTPDAKDNFFKLRIGADFKQRIEALRHLQRMNIFRLALFPGLEGFAQSLTMLVSPDTLVPDKGWRWNNTSVPRKPSNKGLQMGRRRR